MTRWVVDCSMVMAWCLPDEDAALADRFFDELGLAVELIVPELFWSEVANTLIVGQRRKRLSKQQAVRIARLVGQLPLQTRGGTGRHLQAIVGRGVEHVLSGYDTTYLELALGEGAGLATLDTKLSTVAAELGCVVVRREER